MVKFVNKGERKKYTKSDGWILIVKFENKEERKKYKKEYKDMDGE